VGIKQLRRVRAVAECVDIIKAAATGASVDYEGELYEVHNLRFGWLGSPPPPVFVGASQDQMLRMAARVADGSMMSDMPLPLAAAAIDKLDRALEQQSKSRPAFQTNAFAAWHLYDDRERAVREARQWMVLRGIFRPWALSAFLDDDAVELVMRSADAFWTAFRTGSHIIDGVPDDVLDAMVDNLAFVGSYGDIDQQVEKLRRFETAGLGAISLRLYADPAASIKLIGEQVVPALG